MQMRIIIFIPLFFLSFSSGESFQNSLIDITTISSEFSLEIRYATPNNFMDEILYECEVCLLQIEVAKQIVKANQYFCEKGYRIKLYDCYRPLDIQKKMWAKMPRPTYIANPYEGGSIHNRGAAIDLTLESLDGCFVDMGSDYDFFGNTSHINNFNFSAEILANRKLLLDGMRQFGFQSVRTEWWHFNFSKNWKYPVLNVPLPCSY